MEHEGLNGDSMRVCECAPRSGSGRTVHFQRADLGRFMVVAWHLSQSAKGLNYQSDISLYVNTALHYYYFIIWTMATIWRYSLLPKCVLVVCDSVCEHADWPSGQWKEILKVNRAEAALWPLLVGMGYKTNICCCSLYFCVLFVINKNRPLKIAKTRDR